MLACLKKPVNQKLKPPHDPSNSVVTVLRAAGNHFECDEIIGRVRQDDRPQVRIRDDHEATAEIKTDATRKHGIGPCDRVQQAENEVGHNQSNRQMRSRRPTLQDASEE